jgi:hypothetical protein
MFDGESGFFVDMVLGILGRITPVGLFCPRFCLCVREAGGSKSAPNDPPIFAVA